MSQNIFIDHDQAVIDACIDHFQEAPPVGNLAKAIGHWLRFGPKKSIALKLHDSDGGGYVYLITDHTSGQNVKGCTDLLADRPNLSAEEVHAIKLKRIEREARARERAHRKSELLASYARRIWNRAGLPADEKSVFPYLEKKGFTTAKNVRFFESHKRRLVIIPMICPFYGLRSLYLIYKEGFKRPLKGTSTKGLMMAISDIKLNDATVIWITEGYATGLSLHNVYHQPVVVAFTSGNLINVISKLIQAYPNAALKLCADNDVDTFNKRGFNPGLDAAKKVKEAYSQVEIFIPEFPEEASGLSDFNDLDQYLKSKALKPMQEGDQCD